MSRLSLFPLLLVSTLLTAELLTSEQMVQKGSAVSALLVQKLGGELTTQMQSGGPIATLHFCSQNALALTNQIAQETQTSIKRVSILNRNPVNAATDEEKNLILQWEAMLHKKETLPPYELKKLSNGQSVYYKPIVINKEACLKCHGAIATDSPLGKAIKEAYPDDKATGYKMGDLRGMIAVTF
ncbi:Tll0287-like domain-containing protein [Sulfuricurvum sp.]|uniref:Tll0287-like domain-containing protein n=1 Tax=Sulfuricurvum sp. TaxID=2025608 RepID=UPI003BAE9841